jgi:hypothetical protein
MRGTGQTRKSSTADMRAKFQISHIKKHSETCEELFFHAVCRSDRYPDDGSDEDNTYAKFSPCGALSLTVANPALIGKFVQGEKYYLDFTKVPEGK